MDEEPNPLGDAPPRPALIWAWHAGPGDDEPGVVDARLNHLVASGAEALMLVAQQPGTDALRLVRQAASDKHLRVLEDPAARAVRLEPGLSDMQIESLARMWVERTDLDAVVCAGPDQSAEALFATARRLRRQLDRLAWARFQ